MATRHDRSRWRHLRNGHFYDGERPISPAFDDVTAITGAADVVFANYEMPLSTRGQPIEAREHSRRSSDRGGHRPFGP